MKGKLKLMSNRYIIKAVSVGVLACLLMGCSGIKLASNDTKADKTDKTSEKTEKSGDIALVASDNEDDEIPELTVEEVVRVPTEYDGRRIAVKGKIAKPEEFGIKGYVIYDTETGTDYIRLKGKNIPLSSDEVTIVGTYSKKGNKLVF